MTRAGPRVSVGVLVYNGERYLAEAIDSLLAQPFGDFEVIICDNPSTGHTGDIGRSYVARSASGESSRGACWSGSMLEPRPRLPEGESHG